jgi:hypothetical protein
VPPQSYGTVAVLSTILPPMLHSKSTG